MAWEVRKLGDVCELITKGTTPTSIGYKFTQSGINFVKIESLSDNGDLIQSKLAHIDEECHKALRRSQLKENDILFSIAGALGRTIIVKDAFLPANTNQALAIIRLKQDSNISVRYLEKYLNTGIIFDEIEKLKGGVAQQNLSLTQLNALIIPIPPLAEQKRIVAILDEAFLAISTAKENAEKNLKNAKELFESYLNNIFEKKGKDWEEKKLGEVCSLITKGSSPKWQGVSYVNVPGILFVTSENIGEFRLIIDHKKFVEEKFNLKDKKSILKKGDVLTNIVGASIGRTAIYTLDDLANINQAVCILRCKNELLLNVYLMYLLNSPFLRKILHSNEVNTARANLSLSFFSNLSIPLPSLKEQQSIVSKLDALSEQTKKLEAVYSKKIADLVELKKSILQKAFRGEL
jgi:type I restriction enzyme, S subunit